MKKIFIIIFIILPLISFSQIEKKYNNFFVEIFGPSGIGSINYGRLIQIDTLSLFDINVGGIISDEITSFVPQVNILFGNKNYLELGYALTFAFYKEGENEQIHSLRVGYRYQDISKTGFMFRFGFTPFLNVKILGSKSFFPWIGLSFGYVF